MSKEIISTKQGVTLVMLYIFGYTLVIGTGGEAKKDMWIALILGIILAIPVFMMYARLLSMFPEKDIFDILNLVFGNFIGKAISLLFIWFALHIAGLAVYSFSEYISTVALDQTPKVVFMSAFMILCVWGVKEGIEVLGRWGEIMIRFLIFIVFMAVILAAKDLRFSKLLPVLENGINPVMKGAFATLTLPLAETVVFIMVFSCLKDKKATFKAYILGLLLAGVVLIIVSLRNIMVLGTYIISMNYYPSFNAVARINIGNILQRLEAAVSIVFLISGFVQVSICLLGAAKGISKLFGFIDYRHMVIPTALIILNLGFLVVKDMMELTQWNREVFPYYGFFFEVILPGVIFICARMRYKKIYNNDLNNK